MQEKAEQAVRAYFDACNAGDRDAFYDLFEPDACHFLPKGMFGPFRDIESLFSQWRRDALENGSYWLLDAVFADTKGQTACAEWTAVKPRRTSTFGALTSSPSLPADASARCASTTPRRAIRPSVRTNSEGSTMPPSAGRSPRIAVAACRKTQAETTVFVSSGVSRV